MIDASGEFFDYDEGFFAMGGLESLAEWVEQGCPGGFEVDEGTRLGPPVARPSKIVCVGQNYLEHAREMGGELRQNSWTKDMMFGVRDVVSYISRFMTLLPGDVIATGTPSGVAMGMNPPRYLQAGDLVECGVEGLGELTQRVVAAG